MAGGSIPGVDLRSIPDFEAIPAIRDMDAVEATGGKASDVQLEGDETMGPEVHAEIMSLIDQIGPEVALEALRAAAEGGAAPGGPGGPGGGPMAAGGPGGAPMPPQGILSNL